MVNILEGLIGRHNCCELRTEHLDQRFEIARFVGKTLLTAKDVKSSFLNTPGAAKIKALTGKDTLTADFKGVSTGVDVIGNFNVVITANTELHVALDGDKEAWRRRLLGSSMNFRRLRREDSYGRRCRSVELGVGRSSKIACRRREN